MLPVFGPALKPDGETDMVSVDGAVPDVGDTLSQEAFDVAVQLSAPVPLLVSWNDCVAGIARPTV